MHRRPRTTNTQLAVLSQEQPATNPDANLTQGTFVGGHSLVKGLGWRREHIRDCDNDERGRFLLPVTQTQLVVNLLSSLFRLSSYPKKSRNVFQSLEGNHRFCTAFSQVCHQRKIPVAHDICLRTNDDFLHSLFLFSFSQETFSPRNVSDTCPKAKMSPQKKNRS